MSPAFRLATLSAHGSINCNCSMTMFSLGSLSSVARYSSPALSCPSPSFLSSPMSSPCPSTPFPSAQSSQSSSASASSSIHDSPQNNHNHNNDSNISPLPSAITSGLFELAANNSSPTLNMQASPDLRGLPLVLAFHAPRVCVDCGRESSVQWRSGPMGSSTLCNACGMRYMRKRKKEEKKRALLAATQGGRQPTNKKRNTKRAKIDNHQQTMGGKKKSVHVSSSSSEGEDEARASHRASVSFLLN